MRSLGLAAALAAAWMCTGAKGVESPPDSLLGSLCSSAPHDSPISGPQHLVFIPGMGDAHYPADTQNPDAQRWFDYGLQLAHGFAHKDAIEAFRRAERADPACAMCVWGEAWALGPTINYTIKPAETKAAAAVAAKAKAMLGHDAPNKLQLLMVALEYRYKTDGPKGEGDRRFAIGMDAIHRWYPEDTELAVLDADAWLNVARYNDEKAVTQAVSVLEPVLKAHPSDAGAIHFFIHATEAAGRPELAEPYAERLAQSAPAASHLVHMPSHTYYRIGRYEDAALANLAAIRADRSYAEKSGFSGPLGELDYHTHNAQFGIGGAVMSGDAALAIELADRYAQDIPNPKAYSPFRQMAAADVYAAYGRYAEPARVLALPQADGAKPFLQAMRHYARGEAFARLGQTASVREEARQIAVADGDLKRFDEMRPAAQAMVVVAKAVLEGRAAMLSQDPQTAIAAFKRAADLQDSVLSRYSDPPFWWYPVRRSLAAARLKTGDAEGALREAQATLARWKLDPMTLRVLAGAEAALKRPEAAAHQQDALRRWRGTPSELTPDRA